MRRATPLALALAAVAALGAGTLAQSELNDPLGAGGRIEVPEAGYAVTIPDDWVSIRPSAATVDVVLEEALAVVPDLAPTIEAALGGGLGFTLLALATDAHPALTPNCNVLGRAATGQMIEEIGADELAKLDGFEDLLVGPPVLMYLDFPAGRTARLDLDLDLPEFDTLSTSYIYTDGVAVHTLTCTDLERPSDGWASIAATFAFLDTPA